MKKIILLSMLCYLCTGAVHAQNWKLTGNRTTDPDSNFIGTKDEAALVIKVNNIRAGFIDYDYKKASTFLGYKALNASNGSENTALGYQSLRHNTTGNDNTAVGVNAAFSNTSGEKNTAVGNAALINTTTGSLNIGIGSLALSGNRTGNGNIGIGHNALYINGAGNYNTAVGYAAGQIKNNLSNTIALGYNAVPSASNQARIGNAFVTSIGGQVNWTVFSDARVKNNIRENVPGLVFIKALRPVTYQYNVAAENELSGIKNDGVKETTGNDIEKINFTGLIAQEVEKAAKNIEYDFSGIDKTGDIMGLRYSDFVVPLIKSVQELSSENDLLRQNIVSVQKQLDELKTLMQSVTKNDASTIVQNNKIISTAILEQNVPNPFTSSTTVNYTLPSVYSSAKIIIYDKAGKALKQVSISGSGKGSLKVDASLLTSGAFSYALYVDGKLVDSKQMMRIR